MKVDKKDEYFAFQSKFIRRVCMNVITSIVVVVGLYLFIWKQRIGDLIVWILETVFDMKHEAAFYYYSITVTIFEVIKKFFSLWPFF